MNVVISPIPISTMNFYLLIYQGYILPENLGSTNKKLEPNRVRTMERREAIDLLDRPTYPDEMELIRDKRMFLKKCGGGKKN